MSVPKMALALAKRTGWRGLAARVAASAALAVCAGLTVLCGEWLGEAAGLGFGSDHSRFHSLEIAPNEQQAWREGLAQLRDARIGEPGDGADEMIRGVARLASDQFAAGSSVALSREDWGVLMEGPLRLSTRPGGAPAAAWLEAMRREESRATRPVDGDRLVEAFSPWARLGLFRSPAERALDAAIRHEEAKLTPWAAASWSIRALFGLALLGAVGALALGLAGRLVGGAGVASGWLEAAPGRLRRSLEAKLAAGAAGAPAAQLAAPAPTATPDSKPAFVSALDLARTVPEEDGREPEPAPTPRPAPAVARLRR